MAPIPAQQPVEARLADALERVGNALRTQRRREASGEGLSGLQLAVLQHLRRLPADQRITGVLAERLGVRQPTISDAVARLTDRGLLTRRPDAADRRRTLLEPTADAAGMAATTDPTTTVAELLADTDPDDAATALAVVLDLIGAMDNAGLISRVRACTTCRFFARDAHDDPAAPHHCNLLEQPLSPGDLRIECPEHRPVAAAG